METGCSIQELIAPNWKVLKSATGDLNNDGAKDLAFVIQDTNPANFEPNDGLGSKEINLNPRKLAIYFWDKKTKTYKLELKSDQFIVLRDVPTMDEPLGDLLITKEGNLQIDFHFWFSAGSWFTSNHSYVFKHQYNQFELIHYSSYELHRGSGDTTYHDIDFQEGTMKIIQETMPENEGDDEVTTEEITEFDPIKLKTIMSLGMPFNWEFKGLYI